MIVPAVAAGTLGLAIAATAAPAPRAVFTWFAVVVWGLTVIGVVAGILPRAPIPRAAIFGGCLLAAFTALTALSMLWASDPGHALDQVVRASGFTGLFALVVLAARDGEGGAWLRGLALGLVGIAIVALAPRMLPDLFGTPDATIGAQGRIAYPIRYWNGLGALMAAALATSLWLATMGEGRRERCAAAAALVPVTLVLYMAQSRGGLLASVAALAILIAVGPARERLLANLGLVALLTLPLIGYVRLKTGYLERPGGELAADQAIGVLVFTVATVAVVALVRAALDRRLGRLDLTRERSRALLIGVGVVALLAIVAANPVKRIDDFCEPPTNEQLRSDVSAGLSERSGGGRCQFWETAVDAFAEQPLGGIGAGEFAVYWNQNGPFGFPVLDVHSLFLEALGELGIGGFLLIVGFFALAIAAAALRASYVRDGSATAALALLVGGAVAAAFDFAWEIPAVFAPIVVAAALATSAALTPTLINAPPAPPKPPRRSRGGLALAGATLAFGWASLVVCGVVLLADHAIDRSRDAVSAGDYREAADQARRAADLLPFAAEPRLQLGLVYQRAGDYLSARKATLAGIERADEDWRWWRQLALIDGFAGSLTAACSDIGRAQELNPRQPLLYKPIEGLECEGLPNKPPE